MSAEKGGRVFRFELNIDGSTEGDDHDPVRAWLQALSEQINESDKILIEVTGRYIDDPDPDPDVPEVDPQAVSSTSDPQMQVRAATYEAHPKAVVDIMMCPGKRPYT
jgi:hypothetical protein